MGRGLHDLSLVSDAALAAERLLLGAFLAGAEVDEVDVSGEMFAEPWHEAVYDAMLELATLGKPVEVVAVNARMGDKGDFARLAGLTDDMPIAALVDDYAAEVRRQYTLRSAWALADGLKGLDLGSSADEVVSYALRGAQRLDVGSGKETLIALPDMWSAWEAFMQSPQADPVHTWTALDSVIGGLAPGRLYVIGARPAVGKTTIAQNLAQFAAKRGPAAFYSLEMSSTELFQRCLAAHASIPMQSLAGFPGGLDEGERAKYERARHTMTAERAPIFVSDDFDATIASVRRFAKRVQKRHGLSLIVLDYLQLLRTPTEMRGRNMADVIGEFSRELKLMAQTMNVPVVALSQLNRASEVAGRLPTMADLRSSGAIEQDADVIILLSRDDENAPGEILLNVVKNRHGPVSGAALAWQGMYSRAVDMRD